MRKRKNCKKKIKLEEQQKRGKRIIIFEIFFFPDLLTPKPQTKNILRYQGFR